MSERQVTAAQIEERLNRGLLNLWYAVLPSWAVGPRPIGVTRLGQNIVLWRDGEGNVHALEDRCPHRGARLSLGRNFGDKLECWYHGVRVDTNGVIAEVPAVGKHPIVGRKCLKAYPVREIRGAVLLYFGDERHAEPVPLQLPAELTSDEYASMLCVAKWKCNYRYAIDNVMDPMHGAYLHSMSHSMAYGSKQARMSSRKTPTGFVFEKSDQRDVNFDWVEWGESGAMWMRLEIPYGKGAGPGGNFGIVGMATPVDEMHTMVFFWRTRKVSGWQRDVWRFMYRTRLEGLHWQVLEQDRVVLESLASNARDHELLYQHDAGLAKVRRILETRARQQLEEELAAGGGQAS